jgi:NADH:ubiquinone oxidoreductase subunit F (NADH-binding)
MVLVNGAESEPMSFKDRLLLERTPHLVLDGALAAADAVDAAKVVIAVREDAVAACSAVRAAIDERGLGRRIALRPVPVAHLAGQESALIRHLNGGPLAPVVVPPRPFERGLRRRPTLVQNVETIAHLALIERHGPAWFRRLGTPGHPGSALVTIGGAVQRPGVREIACGTPLEEVLRSAGEPSEPLRAVLIGGFQGVWVAATDVRAVRLDDASLARFGAGLAAGVIVALGRTACPVTELAQTMTWLAGESAHQCGPCANGLPAIAGLLGAMAAGRAPSDAGELLARWSRDVTGRGACNLPDGAMRFLSSGVRVFAAELAEHIAHGPCAGCARPVTLLTAPRRQRMAA